MTDNEFIKLLKRNVTLTADYKNNWGKPYVEIKLVTIPDKHSETIELGCIRIDYSDLAQSD